MHSPSYVHILAADAEEALQAPVVARTPTDQLITDTCAAGAFSCRLQIARRAALSEPGTAAQLLSDWMSHDG
jgi:hypothetical protein